MPGPFPCSPRCCPPPGWTGAHSLLPSHSPIVTILVFSVWLSCCCAVMELFPSAQALPLTPRCCQPPPSSPSGSAGHQACCGGLVCSVWESCPRTNSLGGLSSPCCSPAWPSWWWSPTRSSGNWSWSWSSLLNSPQGVLHGTLWDLIDIIYIWSYITKSDSPVLVPESDFGCLGPNNHTINTEFIYS